MWFRRLIRLLLFRMIHDVALMVDRDRTGRGPEPSAAILDSPTVAPAAHGSRGFDGAKKTVGRKRHIAVDAGAARRAPMTGFGASAAALRPRR